MKLKILIVILVCMLSVISAFGQTMLDNMPAKSNWSGLTLLITAAIVLLVVAAVVVLVIKRKASNKNANGSRELMAEDFGKPLDPTLFAEWKQAVATQAKTFVFVLILWSIGLALLITLGGIVGLVLFFVAFLTAMVISLSKQKKTKECMRILDIDNSDIHQANANYRNRTK